MVASLGHPLAIFVLGLGGSFLIPILYRFGYAWLHAGFFLALGGMAIISGVSLASLVLGGPTIEITTAAAPPPIALNLRFGLAEGSTSFAVNLVAFFCAVSLWPLLKKKYVPMILFVLLVMGINGMIMTRDLFNLFVFLEIVSVGTYGLLALHSDPKSLSASFKYIFATVVASSMFLIGTMLLYHVTGILNIDDLLAVGPAMSGPIAAVAILLVAGCLLVELKPYPANGWALDVYETAPPGVAALLSVGAPTGFIFAVWKLIPLFEPYLGLFAILAAVTFLTSNLIGLRQMNVQRMLGYSSVAQMSLVLFALCVLTELGAHDLIPLVVGGIFLNHLLAKAGLFFFCGLTGFSRLDQPPSMRGRPVLIVLLAVLVTSICALPPFPGFWAKWELLMTLSSTELLPFVVLILIGSLAEIAYMFRLFVRATAPTSQQIDRVISAARLAPIVLTAVLVTFAGLVMAATAVSMPSWLVVPLAVGGLLILFEPLPNGHKCLLTLIFCAIAGWLLIEPGDGIPGLFAVLLFAGSLVICGATAYRADPRPGFFPLIAVLILSIQTLLRSTTALQFYVSWELVTLASFFLISLNPRANPHLLRYLIFSVGSAFLLLVGFGILAYETRESTLVALFITSEGTSIAYLFFAIGFLVKLAALGVHIWLPGAYAGADDDVTAMLSAVVSKVAVFGLLLGTYAAIKSEVGLDLAYALAWLGMATTVAGAALALSENDIKRMLAYSSMSQLGYIVTAVALMSHLGWVTALYLTANHLMVKGILFLALAAIILRTGARTFSEIRGLASSMPSTFAAVFFAVISMSGLPPLMGFGGKWLLLSAMAEKGWSVLAVAGVIATLFGLLYMIRLVWALLFRAPSQPARVARDAPPPIVIPQLLLAVGIVVLSLFPKLIMDPISAAIDPQFAANLVWEGQSLETIYGYWDPAPVMQMSVAAAVALFGVLWLARRRPDPSEYDQANVLGQHLPHLSIMPLTTMFWNTVAVSVERIASAIRLVYTGDGQFYAALVLLYILVLCLVGEYF